MIGGQNGYGYECVVVDINTQQDFCAPQGAKPVANLAELIPAFRRIVAWTKRNHAPVVSSIESHRLCETVGNPFRNYCVDGTGGQRKLEFTILAQCSYIEVDHSPACPIDLFRQYQQIIFRKRSEDLLSNPKADRFLTQVSTKEFIVFGVGVEEGIKQLALGLLARHKRVLVVSDASGYWNEGLADLAFKKMRAKGATIITTDQLLDRKLERSQRYRNSRRYQRNGRSSNGNGKVDPGSPRSTTLESETFAADADSC